MKSQGRQVHWFVTENDAAIGTQVDATPWEARRTIMKGIRDIERDRGWVVSRRIGSLFRPKLTVDCTDCTL